MSRIGNSPISLPSGIKCELADGSLIISKGDKLEKFSLPEYLDIELDDGKLFVKGDCKSSFLGLYRSRINNAITGINEQFQVILEIKGVGYRALLGGPYLSLFLGFSHNIKYRIPDYLKVKVEKPTEILMWSEDKDKLNMIASDICDIRKYNPYKKKGINKKGAYIFTKEMNKK